MADWDLEVNLDRNMGIDLIDQMTNDSYLHELRAMAVNRSVMGHGRQQEIAEAWIDRIDTRLQHLRRNQ